MTLGELMIDVSSDARWNDKRAYSRINGETNRLAALAHGLEGKAKDAPDQDQSLQIIGGLFAQETQRTAKLLSLGYRSYARDRLRATLGYCMACHTRAPGMSVPGLPNDPRIASLRPLERASYYASTRQFDRALDAYEKVVTGPEASVNPFDRERAARSALAIAVRVRQDPDRSLQVVQAYMGTPKLPEFMREIASQWKGSIEQWKKEPPRRELTDDGLYAEATRLLSDARQMQKSPTDRNAEVLYLRASDVVHELLQRGAKGPRAAQALLMAGMSYDVLDGLHVWELQEPYYLACVRTAPHSEIAQQCYRRYEESVLLGFTGSAGTNLPDDIRRQLEAVHAEAFGPAALSRPN